jgi:hypothetical protein
MRLPIARKRAIPSRDSESGQPFLKSALPGLNCHLEQAAF